MSVKRKKVDFSLEDTFFETFSAEEYDRGDPVDYESKEIDLEQLEEQLLDKKIHILRIDKKLLFEAEFQNFYDVEYEDVTEFGVYIKFTVGELRQGDLLIFINNEDCLNISAINLMKKVSDMSGVIEVTLARLRPSSPQTDQPTTTSS